jgi:hypothetical protein
VLTATPGRVNRETLELVRAFERLPDVEMRNAAVRFVKTVVDNMIEIPLHKETVKKSKAG